ncbi:hypothetical protein CDAR_408551 [Caerostris darwini]|uniref:Uncharacterized protein n=1 Tax=Caerostris darwini TaxID=1538125 RepID=A0AAV4X6L2_9ARAC|nr:hypothetical protein CDAR_408551 [Caerostris darwini]
MNNLKQTLHTQNSKTAGAQSLTLSFVYVQSTNVTLLITLAGYQFIMQRLYHNAGLSLPDRSLSQGCKPHGHRYFDVQKRDSSRVLRGQVFRAGQGRKYQASLKP